MFWCKVFVSMAILCLIYFQKLWFVAQFDVLLQGVCVNGNDLSNIFSKALICCPIWCSAARCLCQWLSMATMETRVFGQTSRARFISLLSESRINIAGTNFLKCITHISQADLWIKDEPIYAFFSSDFSTYVTNGLITTKWNPQSPNWKGSLGNNMKMLQCNSSFCLLSRCLLFVPNLT